MREKTSGGLDNPVYVPDGLEPATDGQKPAAETGVLHDLQYRVDDNPPWITTILLAIQHYLMLLSSNLATPVLIASTVCSSDPHFRSTLLGDMMFACGVCTLIQTFIGVRLPIVQCPAFAYIVPMVTLTKIGKLKCNGDETQQESDDRLNMIIGSIMVAAVIEVLIGLTGLVSVLMRFIGPLSVAPTIMLMALPAAGTGFDLSGKHWGISIGTMALILLLSEVIPIFEVSRPCSSGDRKMNVALHKMLSVILAVCVMWLLCYILTITDSLPTDPSEYGYEARTDTRLHIITDATWFRFPYPGHRGMPTFDSSVFVAMIAGVITSIIESIGDYYTCARLSGALPPPPHAVNRGILIEGLDCILSASVGIGYGVTSCSQNIGIIDLTKVGSRRVVLVAGFFMALLGCLAKFNSIVAALPDPITGGSFMVLFAVLTAVGASNLQYVNLNSSRNLAVFGMALFLGLGFPPWLLLNETLVSTGNDDFDQVLKALLANNMFVGSFTALLLDNILPGTPEERGISTWNKVPDSPVHDDDDASGTMTLKTYDLPFIMPLIRKWSGRRYVPFMPGFEGFPCLNRKRGCCGGGSGDIEHVQSDNHQNTGSSSRGNGNTRL